MLWAIILYIVFFIANISFMFVNWSNIVNSDASSELVLAALLNREGTFISKNWY